MSRTKLYDRNELFKIKGPLDESNDLILASLLALNPLKERCAALRQLSKWRREHVMNLLAINNVDFVA